jgi:hypothetical protein
MSSTFTPCVQQPLIVCRDENGLETVKADKHHIEFHAANAPVSGQLCVPSVKTRSAELSHACDVQAPDVQSVAPGAPAFNEEIPSRLTAALILFKCCI